jgi:hypothetical protein
MDRLSSVLWAGIIFGVIGYAEGYWLGVVIAADQASYGVVESPGVVLVTLGVGFSGMIGFVLTVVSFVSFPCKWYWEARSTKTARFYDLAIGNKVSLPATAFFLSALACGTMSRHISGREIALWLAIAVLPTVLQSIEFMRPGRQSGRQHDNMPDG